MKIKTLVLFICVVVALAIFAGCNKAELAKLRTDLNQVTNDKNACDAKLAEAEKVKGDITKQKGDLETQIQAMSAEIAQCKAEKAAPPPTTKGGAAAPAKDDDSKKGKKKGKK